MRRWPVPLTLSLLALASAQSGEVRTPEQALTRLLAAGEPQAGWFAPAFLAQVPFGTIAAQLAGLRQTYGAFVRLDVFQGRPLAVYERGTLVVTAAAVDEQGRLTTFGAVPGPDSAPQPAPAPAVPAGSQADVAALLTRLFGSETVDARLFTPEFLAQVPAATLQASLAEFRRQLGSFVRVEASGPLPRAVYERGAVEVRQLQVNAQGQIVALVVAPVAGSGVTEVLTRVFGPETVDAGLFAPEFLAQVPASDLQTLLANIREEFGPLVRVEGGAGLPRLVYERGVLEVREFEVNAEGLITGLFVGPVTPEVRFGTVEEARAAFAALPGQVSLLVQDVATGQAVTALNPSRLLAVGSTFKLAVLGELQAQVTRGERAWTDEVTLTEPDRSLFGGTLQTAPAGGRYTLRDLAARMIRESDNTATDLLLRVVGRPGVEARLGQTAVPNTREAFALKNPANVELLRAYRSAGLNRDLRREVLAQAGTAPLPGTGVFAGGPAARDVEWFLSTQRACALMRDVAALPETRQNPGVATPADFASVSYKGGSEAGVLNLTTQVTTRSGRTLCVSATWNDARTLNEPQFIALYGGLLRLLR